MKNYSIGLEAEQLDALTEIKEKTGATIQWQIRKAIEDYLTTQQSKGGQNGK